MKLYSLTLQTILLTSALAACGQGTMLVDQQATTNLGVYTYGAPFQKEQPAGQSFTPALSSVSFVQFKFDDPSPGNGLGATVYVNLRANSLTGPIVGSTDPVSMPDGFTGAFTSFFFQTRLAVTPGQTYYLQPVLLSGDDASSIVNAAFGFSGGTFFLNGAPNSYGYNAWFREGVLIPEPPSGLLVLLGAVGVWVAGRFRRLRGATAVLAPSVAATAGIWCAHGQTDRSVAGFLPQPR